MLADNKRELNAGWDSELLGLELQALIDLELDVMLTGFTLAEIDLTLDRAKEAASVGPSEADIVPPPPERAATRTGDIWLLGRHRLLCGDARSGADVGRLIAGQAVDLVFTDPPYNVPVNGHVGGLGKTKHREFAFASGEM